MQFLVPTCISTLKKYFVKAGAFYFILNIPFSLNKKMKREKNFGPMVARLLMRLKRFLKVATRGYR